MRWGCVCDLLAHIPVKVVLLLLLNAHLEKHFLLGQVLLLRRWLRDRQTATSTCGQLLLLCLLVLLNFLHEHHLLLLGELLRVRMTRPSDLSHHLVLVGARLHHVGRHLVLLSRIRLQLVLPREHLLASKCLLADGGSRGRLLALDVDVRVWVALA